MVGRILAQLRKRGVLVEPPRAGVAVRRPHPPRPYAIRKPRAYQAVQPGDTVQVDTLDLRPLPGVVYQHCTARDMVSRWDVLEVHTRATATAATTFLGALLQRAPFPVRAIQVDGGSEFQAQFERACQERGIRLFVLPPRSPKLNGCVERAQRTHTEECYQVWDLPWTVTPLNRKLRAWERIDTTVRPHQAVRLSSRRRLTTKPSATVRQSSTFGSLRTQARGSRVSPMYWTSTLPCASQLRPVCSLRNDRSPARRLR